MSRVSVPILSMKSAFWVESTICVLGADEISQILFMPLWITSHCIPESSSYSSENDLKSFPNSWLSVILPQVENNSNVSIAYSLLPEVWPWRQRKEWVHELMYLIYPLLLMLLFHIPLSCLLLPFSFFVEMISTFPKSMITEHDREKIWPKKNIPVCV